MLFGVSSEYINASRELGSFFSPAIIVGVLIMLILATWLIGSGFLNRNLIFKRLEHLMFFVLSCITFAIIAYLTLLSYVVPGDFTEVNGIRIPMNKCIDGTIRIIPDEEERKQYCLCLAGKITDDTELKEKYKKELESGELADIIKALQTEVKFIELDLQSCFTAVEFK